MPSEQKYAKIEWERRFLIERFPSDSDIAAIRKVVDRYITGTTLRLRRQTDLAGNAQFKLTQKLAHSGGGAQQGLITTIYLAEREYEILATLTAHVLRKTRYSTPPLGVDVFEGSLAGLILAEAEFDSAAEASAFVVPSFVSHEVSNDSRFTGGRLVAATQSELIAWLAEYGIKLNASLIDLRS